MTDPAAFEESLFPVLPRRLESYRSLVDRGRSVMHGTRALICGLARDVAPVLPQTISRIERLGRMFADYRAVIYENDSQDATREILDGWQQANRRVVILSECRGEPVNPSVRCLERAKRMAYYRNQYREFAAAEFSDFDYVVVVDTDVGGGWSYDGVANTFGHSGWDFVGSYGIIRKTGWWHVRSVHFDAWAFRPKGSYARVRTRVVNRLRFERGAPIFEVYSCFGGLGVYRTEAMRACQYGGFDCEHVCLHRQMRAAGLDRLYFNPSQIVFYGTRPRKLVRICNRWANRLFRKAA